MTSNKSPQILVQRVSTDMPRALGGHDGGEWGSWWGKENDAEEQGRLHKYPSVQASHKNTSKKKGTCRLGHFPAHFKAWGGCPSSLIPPIYSGRDGKIGKKDQQDYLGSEVGGKALRKKKKKKKTGLTDIRKPDDNVRREAPVLYKYYSVVDLISSSKIGCDGHRKNLLLAENRRYAAMNFGHKVRDKFSAPESLGVTTERGCGCGRVSS